jgi:hypothetical protein
MQEHRGRTAKNTGDGPSAEIGSVIDAVRFAVEVQRGMVDREQAVPDEHCLRFRIGINLSDVIAEDEDIFDDGCISQRGWKRWASRAGSASAARCTTRCATKSSSALRI